MVKVILKTLIAEQFKGATHFEYDFAPKAQVTGENGTGKTTLADAWYWVFTDKDYSLKANPEIHPDFLKESEPSVTVVCDIDGKEVTFRKFQKDSRTKKQKEDGAPVRITNQYEINAVPKTQKDFVSYLSELGIDVDNFLLYSHPEIFVGQKSSDCRKVLFDMVSDITDKEIADSIPDCEELGASLENYTLDEIVAKAKREQKEAEQNLDAIPEQIIGMEKSKIDIDAERLNEQKTALMEEISSMESEIELLKIPSVGELNQKLVLLEKEERNLVAEANSERVTKLTELNARIGDLNLKLRHMQSDRERFVDEIEKAMRKKNDLEEEYNRLSHEYQNAKASEFDMTKTCPYCGQDLPVQEIDKAAKRFEEERQAKMLEINQRAGEIKNKIYPEIKTTISENESAIKNIDTRITDVSGQIEKMMSERAKYETVVTVTGTPEHQEIIRKIAETHHAMNKRDELVSQADVITAKIRERKQAVREIDDVLAQTKANAHIDERIAEAKEMQKRYSQASADASKILDQIKKVSMEKNRMLTEQVNSHFELVRFKLFEQQKNGDFKDCCIPTIRNEDGVYRTFGSSANTALEVRGKLDIINGLQKYYGVYLPVWLDGAECLDEKNREQIHMDTQLIMLSVSNSPLTVKGE